ncbi:phage holin family protein [uncultured Megamonas sp.]|uniref:phage holin family protein n=1 Tax=uncultured Megamonas sp. TaxID=286140 RepID=UPI00259B6CC6|nr:phage holin family protein [uncultured Megamonas sp.]
MYEQILSFISSLIPTRLEIYIGGGVAFVGIILQHFFGAWNNQMEVLLIFMVVDYLTGLSAAFIQNNVYLDSRKGFKGIIKKIVILCLVVLAHQIDVLIGQNTLTRNVVLFFFIGNEGLSILENASNCGLPVPKKLKDTLAQFTEIKAKK